MNWFEELRQKLDDIHACLDRLLATTPAEYVGELSEVVPSSNATNVMGS